MSEEISEEIKETPRTISRRKFLRDAGIVVGGTAVSSAFFLSACGEEVEVTKTVTTTAPGSTSTVTTTAPGATSTVTKTAADNTVTVTKYTCPVCNQEFDSLEALKAHFDSVHESEGKASKTQTVKFTVNNHAVELNILPSLTLWQVLREDLGYISPKEMCSGWGACGSCTVNKDGKPVLSCMVLAVECENAIIETAEGILLNNHPLIEAYSANNTMQCGYCTPGFLVTAKALLDHNANPTKEEIMEALAGNICRCGTYPMHPIAVAQAAKEV